MTAKYRKILFAGSFNPFTAGHADLVDRALTMFDAVVIAVGVNAGKSVDAEAMNARVAAIRELYPADSRVEVVAMTTLAVECAAKHGCCALLRGVRSTADFEYERRMADLNLRLSRGSVDTVMLPARPELEAVSSSAVRELSSYGVDVGWMLPKKMN